MDDVAELWHSKSDEVVVIDDTMGGQGLKELAAMLTKQCNSLPVPKQMDQNGKTTYLSLENPDKRGIMRFMILMVTKLFNTVKGKGEVEVWQAAVDNLNSEVNTSTCCNLFDPPIAVKTVSWCFNNAMKLTKEICAAVPFHSGCDNKECPNSLQSLLEDLYDAKISLE
jgi:hypothetical protein